MTLKHQFNSWLQSKCSTSVSRCSDQILKIIRHLFLFHCSTAFFLFKYVVDSCFDSNVLLSLCCSLRKQLCLEEPSEELCAAVVLDTTHDEEVVRVGASLALAQVLAKHRRHIPTILKTLLNQYEAKLYVSHFIYSAFHQPLVYTALN